MTKVVTKSGWGEFYYIALNVIIILTKTLKISNIQYKDRWKLTECLKGLNFPQIAQCILFCIEVKTDDVYNRWLYSEFFIILYNILKIAELDCCQIIILSIYVPSTHVYTHVLCLSLDLPYETR